MNKVVNDCGDQPTEEAKTGRKLTDDPCPHCGCETLDGYWTGGWMEDYVVYCTVKTCDYKEEV